MDIGAIQGALASLKTAADIARAITDLKVTSEVQTKIIELQNALLSAQGSAIAATTQQFELQEKVRALEAHLASHDDWSRESQRYSLISMWGGSAQAFALKQDSANGEHPHLLCPQCFVNRKKGMLASVNKDGWVVYVCPSCKNTIATGYRGIGAPKFVEQYGEQAASR